MITNCESGIILQKQRTSFLLLEFRLRFFQVKDHGMCDLESVNLYDFVHCNGVSLKQDGFIRRKGSSNDWALYLSDGPARADCLEAFCKAKQSNDLFYISDDAVSIFLGKIFAAHFSPDVLPVASEASRCFSGPEDSAVSPSFTSKLGDKESLRDKQPEFIFFSSGWQVCTVYDLWRIWNDVTQIRLAIRLFSRTPKVQDSEALHENAGRLEKPSSFQRNARTTRSPMYRENSKRLVRQSTRSVRCLPLTIIGKQKSLVLILKTDFSTGTGSTSGTSYSVHARSAWRSFEDSSRCGSSLFSATGLNFGVNNTIEAERETVTDSSSFLGIRDVRF